MSKRIIRYIALWGSGCGLSTDTPAQIMREHGTSNVKHIRNATQEDIDWVRCMGGRVPEGRIATKTPQPLER